MAVACGPGSDGCSSSRQGRLRTEMGAAATAAEQVAVEIAASNAAAEDHEAATAVLRRAKEAARKKFQKRQKKKTVDFQDFKINFDLRENLLRIIYVR